ncbi:MAG: glycosyltransferase [Prevotellaceae bacterium]|jgi:glycosyltransferase involved in cell wall biosynthesis|nr:glycosyltransferase [Prevotellaceae bacterium]
MLFSIITVTYNAEKVLERTILSVLNQTYPQLEYIIVDGNSSDKTKAIIEQYAAGISMWISEPDRGLYDAMNKGLRMATGDYVWFLNAGDTLHSKATIEEAVRSIPLAATAPDVIYGETNLMNMDEKFIAPRRLKAPKTLTWRSFSMGMLVCHQSFIVKRSIAPAYNLRYLLTADFDWCIRCLKRAKHIHNTHLILSNFLTEGLSSQKRKASLKERFRIMSQCYGLLPTIFRHVWFALRFYAAKLLGRQI